MQLPAAWTHPPGGADDRRRSWTKAGQRIATSAEDRREGYSRILIKRFLSRRFDPTTEKAVAAPRTEHAILRRHEIIRAPRL